MGISDSVVDPRTSLLYVRSHVPEHTELHYLLECATGYGEAHRMIQFKEKSGPHTRLSLLTYPVPMAADILLHDVRDVRAAGAQRAGSRGAVTVRRATEAIGLLTRAARGRRVI
ncbi:MAG TPA: hypothetical protein VGP31_10355 [Planosporangium sp.]|nr:hypothetical protein [Planosporangium sp.]